MPNYVIERTVRGAGQMDVAALAGLADRSNEVLRELSPDVHWMHSYITDDKIVCGYQSTGTDLIREHGHRGGFPVDAVLQIRATFDPSTAEMLA